MLFTRTWVALIANHEMKLESIMSEFQTASREEWLVARKALLEEEKKLTRQREALANSRRNLPLVAVETDYQFHSETGVVSLADLFGGRRQLAIYHFMFGRDWEEGCPSCSLWADSFNGNDAHFQARDTAFACVSEAPLEKLLAYRDRMGWSFPWVSSQGSTFGLDFGVSFGDEAVDGNNYNYSDKPATGELPGLSTFLRGAVGAILHSYSTYARGLENFNTVYGVLDFTPLGRHEDDLSYPMAWVRRKDQYNGSV